MEIQILQDGSAENMLTEDDNTTMVSQKKSDPYINDANEESSHIPSHLLNDGEDEECEDSFTTAYILTTERQSPNHVIPYSQQTEQCEDADTIPDLCDSTARDNAEQQHIITIIQDSDEENNLRAEDGVPKEMLKRFVIDPKGIRPSIRPIDNSGTSLDVILQTSQAGDIPQRQESGIGAAGHQHVVIFSTSPDTVTQSDDDSHKLTIALVPDERGSFPEMLGGSHDNSQQSIELPNHNKDREIGLDMAFEVVAELEAPDGEIVMREITTQTRPQKKRLPRKRKLKNSDEPNNLLSIESTNNVEMEDDSSSAKRFRCTKCNLKFTNQETCDVHIRCHIAMCKDYQCCFCDFTETKWTKMHQHLFKHGIQKPHKCDRCTFTCRSKSDLTAHMAVHSSVKEFRCPKCNRFFKHRRNLVAHGRTCSGVDESGRPQQIEGQDKYVCNVCKKQLASKKNLDKHMEIHLELKPFVCDQCGHSTRLKESLIMHKRLHTGEKPFRCDICNYATPDKSSLRRHKRRHTNEKPYQCAYCPYKSIQKHCLDTHIRRKHTGEQFVCGLCHYATHDRYGLNQHFKRHQNADGSIVHEIEIVDDEKRNERLSNLTLANPPPSSTTYIALPSGAVLKSTTSGKNTTIEESQKKPADDECSATEPPQKLETAQQALEPQAQGDNESNEHRDADSEKGEVAVELGELEAQLLQQIQMPGDEIFIQATGEIVIRRQDGHLLVIQRQDIEEEETNEETGEGEAAAPEYLTAVPPSEISGTVVDDVQGSGISEDRPGNEALTQEDESPKMPNP